MSRLALGTVQLGVPYGVANYHGQPSAEEAFNIIKISFENGLRIFDTAQAYGESEFVLGKSLHSLGIADKVKVISKLHPDLTYNNPSCLQESVVNSLKKLNVPCLYGLMIHRASWLNDWNKGLGASLAGLKERHLIKYLGVSVYTAKEAHDALDIDEIEMIQAPFNIFDRRIILEGVLDRAFQLKKKMFLRSFFLQGLILISPEDLPRRLSFAGPWLVQLNAFCLKHGVDKKEFAFKYAWQKTGEATLVTGVERSEQIKENLNLICKHHLDNKILKEWESLNLHVSEKLINPFMWV